MTPLDAVDFARVRRHHLHGALLGRAHIPKFDRAIATSCEELVLIGLIEADVEASIGGLHLAHH